MSASNTKILRQIEMAEAAAHHFIEEATELKKMLKGVSTPFSTRKGLADKAAAKCITNRNRKLVVK